MLKRICILLFFIGLVPNLFGQDTVVSDFYGRTLTNWFDVLEGRFNCTFSYEDSAVFRHVFNDSGIPDDLPSALEELRKKTLFEYQLLEDNTVTVSPRDDLRTYCVEVIAEDTGAGLPGSPVWSAYQFLVTDDFGRVTFLATEEPFYVVASFLGYANELRFLDPTLPDEECQEIKLQLEAQDLNPVMLTNFITKGISKKADGAVNINYDGFDILPGLIESDVLLTIKELPGIQSVNETVSFLNIRGGTNDQNLILWDGIKMYQSGHFFGLISAFNPNLTKEVDVYKSVGHARYGDGVSGIISMSGNRKLVKDLKINAGINLLSADVMAEIPITDRLSLEVAGRHSLNSLFTTPTYDAYFDKAFQNTELQSSDNANFTSNDDFKFFDAHLRLQYQLSPKDKFRLSLLRLGNRLEFLENGVLDGEPQARSSRLMQDNSSAGLFYSRSWSDKVQTQVQWYGSGYELMAINADIENNQRLIQENDLVETGIKVENAWRVSERFEFRQGYQFNETGITNFENINNPTFERSEKQVLRTHSLFGSVRYETADAKNRLEFGLRASHVNKFDEVLLEPRLHFTRRISNNLSVELLGALNSQTTSQVIDLQNDFLGVENRRWILSNPGDIPIIKGKHLGMAINYQRKGWLFSAEPYAKEIRGITSQSQGFQNQFEDERTVGKYTVYGLDFLANKQWDKANIWISYSFAQNDYDFPELTPREFPNNLDIRHNISVGTNFIFGNFNVGAGVNWHSGKPFTPAAESSVPQLEIIIFEPPNSQTIQNYFRVDASATYTYDLSERVTLVSGISLWNLLDNDNTVNTFFRVNEVPAIQQVNDLSLRFTPNATVRFIFK